MHFLFFRFNDQNSESITKDSDNGPIYNLTVEDIQTIEKLNQILSNINITEYFGKVTIDEILELFQ